MVKFLFKTFLLLLVAFVAFTLYLSFFGIETKRFNDLIKNKSNEVNERVKLDFNKIRININISELNLLVKIQNPKIIVKKEEINLSKLDLFLSMKAFFGKNFLLQRAEVAFTKNDIKDISKITNIFVPKIINKQIKRIFKKGNISGQFFIPFEVNGDVGKNYSFLGKVSDATISLPKNFKIKNLTTDINYDNANKNDGFTALINKASLFNLNFDDSKINIIRKNGELIVKSSLRTKGKIENSHINKLAFLFNKPNDNIKDIEGAVNLNTKLNFNLVNRFKVKNLSYTVNGSVDSLKLHFIKDNIISNYLTDYKSILYFKDTNINFTNLNRNQSTNLDGFLKINNEFDPFKLNIKLYSNKKKDIELDGTFDLTNSNILIENLNFKKISKKKANINIKSNFILNNHYDINKFEFISNKNKILLNTIKLNKNFEVSNFKDIKVFTIIDGKVNNDFHIKKNKKILASGRAFDAQPLLKSLFSSDNKKIFSKNFNSKIDVNFEKIFTGNNDDVVDFSMIASILKGSYEKLILKGNFSKDEFLEMSIYKVDSNKKTIQVISDRARPFLKNFNFIKGFEGGKLEYESTIFKDNSVSKLVLKDFKVSKVPALAQLLTLASLQGIADTLSGEGIRFELFEMQSSTKGNVINIEDILALGPAVSILMDGYVDKGNIVSLSGTLVPATKLNSIIASIPIVGDILVGKKTGEGVVGVSFKMKGPPKDIKTTVNPIKTLTPRFIVRALEKMKKKKEKEAK